MGDGVSDAYKEMREQKEAEKEWRAKQALLNQPSPATGKEVIRTVHRLSGEQLASILRRTLKVLSADVDFYYKGQKIENLNSLAVEVEFNTEI